MVRRWTTTRPLDALFPNGMVKTPFRQEMTRGKPLVGASGFIYSARVVSARPVTDFTARVVPSFPGVAVPLEMNRILWQH